MNNQELKQELSRLYAMAEAGEKGYTTAAVNIPDHGLKLLLKSLMPSSELSSKNSSSRKFISWTPITSRGAAFWGWSTAGGVAIYAAMTIQTEPRELTILKEAEVGERAAMRSYARALEKDLPPAVPSWSRCRRTRSRGLPGR